jgi:hypothetical protein
MRGCMQQRLSPALVSSRHLDTGGGRYRSRSWPLASDLLRAALQPAEGADRAGAPFPIQAYLLMRRQ